MMQKMKNLSDKSRIDKTKNICNFLENGKRRYSLNVLKNKFHDSQTQFFEEELILVNEKDTKISSITKIDAHLLSQNNKFPHRAFSVFLFNEKNQLLLQRRSKEKITFPYIWSNTCCSHPLNNQLERNEIDNQGIKSAVTRRMAFELGLETKINDYKLIEKILYRATSDSLFEEFELDYIFLMKLKLSEKDISSKINPDEVSDIKFMYKEELKEILNNKDFPITPWFELVIKKKIDEIYKLAENFEKFQEKKEYEITSFL